MLSSVPSLRQEMESYTYRGKRIPAYMYEEIENYIFHGRIDQDDFLWNVVTNNLIGVFKTADSQNINCIDTYVGFFYNAVPGYIWGSVEKVIAHINSFKENSNV